MIIRFIQIGIPFLWLGFVLAISFLEAPLKFQAEGITTELGLGIGRLVFFMLNKIELIFCLVLGFSWMSWKGPKSQLIIYLFLGIILMFQTFFLLPSLDERAVLILSGAEVPESNLHFLYISLDVLKCLLLSIYGWFVIRHATEINT